jgi:hypothetical protein
MLSVIINRRRARYHTYYRVHRVLKLIAAEALRPGRIGASYTLTPLENRNGWVNPEDLAPMPQCISQQDQSVWLGAMTRCTSKQCTRHFGVICTHHQWLTQLSCLSTEFSPDIVRPYLPLCGRSVLAKAQLFEWIHSITGRMWLVNVGDANGLQRLSPTSLAKGYMAVEATDKAPTCLMESDANASTESFDHVMASCGFTSNTRHTGNAARPWEYSETMGSMVALDSKTAGYDLTGRGIAYGDYFDKRCFCETFSTDKEAQLCPGPSLASTKERLWLNATCGADSLPADWTDGLQTTPISYIATKDWRWPQQVASKPRKLIRLADHCTTDACRLDSEGYCKVVRAVDRACFCHETSYDDCKGPCRAFEARIDYINWLHDLCGNVENWHGLPKHWRQLARPTLLDMIPWRWTVKSSREPDLKHCHSKSCSTCASTEWKLGSVVLVNLATLLAGLYALTPRSGAYTLGLANPQPWFLSGLALVQATAGYETVSIVQLMLFWCSMPRLTWVTIFLIILCPFQKATLYTLASCVVAETILQALTAIPMLQTINYGWEHDFYSDGMEKLETAPAVQYMYVGAVMWLIVVIVSLALVLKVACEAIVRPEGQQRSRTLPSIIREMMVQLSQIWTLFENWVARHCEGGSRNPEQEPLVHEPTQNYGTLPIKGSHIRSTSRTTVRLTIIAMISSFLLWIAQCLFWFGFISHSAEEYVPVRAFIAVIILTRARFCPPKLETLTAGWIVVSVAVTTLVVAPRTPVGKKN